jgi:hypothetical protein
VVGLAEDMNDSMDRLGIAAPRVSRTLAIWNYILILSMLVPYANLLTSIPALIVQINVWKQVAGAADAITAFRSSVSE